MATGLFLLIQPGGSKSWVCRVQKNGNRRDFGLGSASKVSLALARERAREIRTWVEMGLDPIFERRKVEGIPTFKEAVAKVLAAHRKTWRNEKHEGQWLRTLEAYVFPQLGNMWPAAGLVDTEIRCFHRAESINATKEVRPRVQA